MTFADVLRLALGSVTAHRLPSALTVLGIVIGIASVVLLTSLGSLAGLVLGIGFSKAICVFLSIPLFLAPGSFFAAFFVASAFGVVFALFPAWKASRLSPMEALRYE